MVEEGANLVELQGCLAACVFARVREHCEVRRLDLQPVVVMLSRGRPWSEEHDQTNTEKECGSRSVGHNASDVKKERVKVKQTPCGATCWTSIDKTGPLCDGLFVSQRYHRIDACSPPRRNVACRQRNARKDRRDCGKRQRIARFHAEKQSRDQPPRYQRAPESERQAGGPQPCTFLQYLLPPVFALR